MNIKLLVKVLGLGLLASLIFVGLNHNIFGSRIAPNAQNQAVLRSENISFSVEGLYSEKSVAISSGETVLNVLEKLNKEDTRIQLVLKEYAGLGVLVESIVGKRNGTQNKYWQYKVNEVMPQIGADKLILHDGDKIQWYFSSSEF